MGYTVSQNRESMFYFNNCHRREHARMYGKGAFYDLDRTGFQARLAKNLAVGEQCIVATPAPDGQITFTWFSFVREDIKPDDTGTLCRVLFGTHIKSDQCSKASAAKDGLYGIVSCALGRDPRRLGPSREWAQQVIDARGTGRRSR
jgi:hypothetical protein